MNQKFTHQKTAGFFSAIDNKDTKKLNPAKQSVFLVRQFAHAYHVEKTLPQTLNGIILN
jgi:hypothetical protein